MAHASRGGFCAVFLSALAALCITSISSTTVSAQPNWTLELYGDAQMSSCTISYSAPGIIQVHIFQTGDTDSGASEFSLYPPDCLPGVAWLADVITPPYIWLENTQTEQGIAVAFRGCATPPIYVGYVNFYVTDLTVECCGFNVTDPISPYTGIRSVGCRPPFDSVIYPMATKGVMVNPNPQCPCDLPVAVESTTWGKIKSFYR